MKSRAEESMRLTGIVRRSQQEENRQIGSRQKWTLRSSQDCSAGARARHSKADCLENYFPRSMYIGRNTAFQRKHRYAENGPIKILST